MKQRFIVAEISGASVGLEFEKIIAKNDELGYLLESWHMSPTIKGIKIIIAVFEYDRQRFAVE